MKRPEMLQIIKDKWKDSTSFPTDDAVANFILDAIEKAGMLPPYRLRTEKEKENIDAINQYDYCHRWESENE